MIRPAMLVCALTVTTPALAADGRAAVPVELQAAWARDGHCLRTNERLDISAFRAGWGEGYAGAIHFDAERRALVWDSDSRKDYFALGPRGLQLIHVQPDGERERLTKCPGKLIRGRR
jgi:hypothetical protein